MGDIAAPAVFVALMLLEFGWNAWRARAHQDPRDAAVSVLVAIPHFALLSIVPVVWVVLYRAAWPQVPWQLPVDAWWIWPLGVVVMDLAAYWMHRYHHALNLTWAVHAVHHSSPYFTMTTGGRSSLAEPLVNVVSGAYLILVAPVALGLPLPAAALGWIVKDTWGFAVHTRNIGRLGPLERVLATPTHHAVHHGRDQWCRGKNFGFVFIVWDRLFGTFARGTPTAFGVDDPPPSLRPLTVALHHLAQLGRAARTTSRARDKLRLWFMPAGWRPRDAAPTATDAARAPAPAPPGLYLVGTLQLAYLGAMIWALAATLGAAGVAADLAALGFLLYATVVSGEFFERSPRYLPLELARALAIGAMIACTGAWFGRPLDTAALGLLALAGLNLLAAAAVTWRGHTATPVG
ncbi:MAG: sterol desaturase family protein [Myxococcales bacterium]|nr:sterol desaturase family protein [Myxococcales bacterium]